MPGEPLIPHTNICFLIVDLHPPSDRQVLRLSGLAEGTEGEDRTDGLDGVNERVQGGEEMEMEEGYDMVEGPGEQ